MHALVNTNYTGGHNLYNLLLQRMSYKMAYLTFLRGPSMHGSSTTSVLLSAGAVAFNESPFFLVLALFFFDGCSSSRCMPAIFISAQLLCNVLPLNVNYGTYDMNCECACACACVCVMPVPLIRYILVCGLLIHI